MAIGELKGGVVLQILRAFGGEGVLKKTAADNLPTSLQAIQKRGDVGVDKRRRGGGTVEGDVVGEREISPVIDEEGRVPADIWG